MALKRSFISFSLYLLFFYFYFIDIIYQYSEQFNPSLYVWFSSHKLNVIP